MMRTRRGRAGLEAPSLQMEFIVLCMYVLVAIALLSTQRASDGRGEIVNVLRKYKVNY